MSVQAPYEKPSVQVDQSQDGEITPYIGVVGANVFGILNANVYTTVNVFMVANLNAGFNWNLSK
ncbi:hypothetical protein M2139_000449 [Enterococcus sp. PF1-24]|uniref:hypothetical protein n=1 Tax=unclassified Enterococcus TaxID=2608891 RepID=UPI002473CE73|nr:MULTISPECIES: hypothetical protein [unclassified Enterococcus]MDH6363474.1 hypothetical protein [Enterococcus sp. PFB1-1]MDH6400568.1 hypothetical protein [Enterococcus sp. PF1-24]